MFKGLFSIIRSYNRMPEAEQRTYQAEKENNFRWVSQLFASPAPFLLISTHLIQDSSLRDMLSEIGQFAEVAHGSIEPKFIWKHMSELSMPGYPLEQYAALSRSHLCPDSPFHGNFVDLQGYVAHRPDKSQLIVAFSGTSSFTQALQSLRFPMVPHPNGAGGRVHLGFWRMYSGIREVARSHLMKALKIPGIVEIIFTGHSMGAVISYLFCIDILEDFERSLPLDHALRSKTVKVVAFGAPRVGDHALAQRWSALSRKYGVIDYSIRNYNDGEAWYSWSNYYNKALSSILLLGVPMLPPQSLGYCHLSNNPLYFAYGHLWSIPPSYSEYSLFTFEHTAIRDMVNPFPLGGHNYYNVRDMELLQRRMKWFGLYKVGDTWDDLKRRFEEQLKLERGVGSRVR